MKTDVCIDLSSNFKPEPTEVNVIRGMPTRDQIRQIKRETDKMFLVVISSPKVNEPFYFDKRKNKRRLKSVATAERIQKYLKQYLKLSEQNRVISYFIGEVDLAQKENLTKLLKEGVHKSFNDQSFSPWFSPITGKIPDLEFLEKVDNIKALDKLNINVVAVKTGRIKCDEPNVSAEPRSCCGGCGGKCSDKKCNEAGDINYSLKA